MNDVQEALYGGHSGNVAGYYSDNIDGSYAVSHRTQGRREDLNPQAVLFHEYGHHFMYRYFPFAYPGWYREGFAEYYATTTFDEEGNWTYGRPPLYRGSTLMGVSQVPVQRMLTIKESDLQPQEAYQIYSRGWLLTHMLHSDPERMRQLNDFLTAVAKGTDKREAAEAAFGDLDDFDRELRRYLGESPVVIAGREPISYDGRLDVTTLDEVGSELVELSLANRRSHDRDATRDRLASLAGRAPDRAPIWAELAEAEHMLAHKAAGKDGKPDMRTALAAANRAIAVDSDYLRGHALKAELLLDVADARGDTASETDWAAARDAASAANALNPDRPAPLMLFYDSYAQAGEAVPEVAHQALARAFELAPEVDYLRVKYALDLAQLGEYDQARSVVEFLVADPHASKLGERTLKRIEAIREGQPWEDIGEDSEEDEEDD